ncbi:MAG: glycosyltransferase, partial [Bacteroidota bacterium]
YDIHYFGIGYDGPILQQGSITIYPNQARGTDIHGLQPLSELGQTVQPDLVFLLHDLRYQKAYLQALESLHGQSKFISYTPLDGKVVHGISVAPVKMIDYCVCYTEFAQEEITKALSREGEHSTTIFDVIPHGVDTQTFYPLPEEKRKSLKRDLFPHLPNPKESFIVLNANRIDPRKRIDITLKGFAQFAANKPENVKLYLHHPFLSEGKRRALQELIDEYQIEHRLLFNRDQTGSCRPVSDAQLNQIYNATDVGINTAMGEGWGLVSMEHAACRVPQIVPRHSALTEIWADAADFLESTYQRVPWFSEFEMVGVSATDLANQLERLYTDWMHWETMADTAYNRATEDRFNWTVISQQWARLFKKVEASLATNDKEQSILCSAA